jgi:NAD(P)-dependent dehydrogenase (short-subunit alcohol dehydrogenase family)
VLAVNLKGAFRLSVLAAEAMDARGGGSIVNVSSISAVRPRQEQIPYALAKAGLNCLTVAMARAAGPNVRVNAVMPGPFLTDISRAWDAAAFAQRAATDIPLRRAGEPHEIVGTVLYLASDASSYTTGAVIKVDGGEAFSPA